MKLRPGLRVIQIAGSLAPKAIALADLGILDNMRVPSRPPQHREHDRDHRNMLCCVPFGKAYPFALRVVAEVPA